MIQTTAEAACAIAPVEQNFVGSLPRWYVVEAFEHSVSQARLNLAVASENTQADTGQRTDDPLTGAAVLGQMQAVVLGAADGVRLGQDFFLGILAERDQFLIIPFRVEFQNAETGVGAFSSDCIQMI